MTLGLAPGVMAAGAGEESSCTAEQGRKWGVRIAGSSGGLGFCGALGREGFIGRIGSDGRHSSERDINQGERRQSKHNWAIEIGRV